MRQRLRWADGKLVKESIDQHLMGLLGPRDQDTQLEKTEEVYCTCMYMYITLHMSRVSECFVFCTCPCTCTCVRAYTCILYVYHKLS